MLNRKMAICLLLCAIAVIMTSSAWSAPGDVSAGLAFWLKADSGLLNSSGLPAADGAKIATWQDQSGNAVDATQSTDAYRPVLVANSTLNNQPAVKFTSPMIPGATSTVFSQLVFNQFLSGQNVTAFMVLRPTGKVGYNWYNGAAWHFGNYNEGQTFSNGYSDQVYGRTGQIRDDFGVNQSAALYTPTGGFNFGSNYLYNISMEPGTRETYLNGNLVESMTTDPLLTNNWSGNPSLGMAMQWQDIGGGVIEPAPYLWGYDGLIAEVIIYNRTLTVEERDAVGSYLTAKYGLTTKYNAPGGVINGLKFWLKADQGAQSASGTPAADGEKIAAWKDQSGNGLEAVQTEDVFRPTLVANSALNNLPAVQFTSPPIPGQWNSTEYSQLVFDKFMSGLNTTAFMVLRPTGLVGNNWYNGSAWNIGNYNEGQIFGDGYTDPIHGQEGGRLHDNFGLNEASATFFPTGGFNIGSNYLYDVSLVPGTRELYVNGKMVNTQATNSANFNNWSNTPSLGISRDANGPFSYGYDGLIAEIIIYERALSAEEKTAVGKYLADKYDITSKYNSLGGVVEGLKFWLKADEGVLNSDFMIAADGEQISTWKDQSGNENDATQSDVTFMPALVSSSMLNSMPAVKFTSPPLPAGEFTSTEFSELVFNPFMSGLNATAFMVMRPTGVVGNGTFNGPAWSFGNYNEILVFGSPAGNLHDNFGLNETLDPDYTFVPAGGFNINSNYLYSVSLEPGTRKQYLNGNLVFTGATNPLLTNNWTQNPSLGIMRAWQDIGGVIQVAPYLSGYDGLISEIIIYNRMLTPEEKAVVETYLTNKYAITNIIPETYSISGTVNLLNYYGDYTAIPVTIVVNGNSVTLPLDADGNFTITDVPAGHYEGTIKPSHWLGKAYSFDLTGNLNIGIIEFINGDVVDNNEVDFSDINAARAAYGSFPGDETWNERADVDGSGEVDFTDINIVRGNYGEIGE